MKQIMEYSQQNMGNFLGKKIEPEEYNYFIKLNESLVEFIQSISQFLKNSDDNKKELFMNYIPEITDYLISMLDNQMFNPSNDYLNSILVFLIDFLEIYNKFILKKLNDYSWQRIFQLANNSNDDNIIHLKDYLQNKIFAIRMKN